MTFEILLAVVFPVFDFATNSIDFSCVSPWNDGAGALRAGTLISKRHVIFAKHFPVGKGTRILFVDQEGEVCPCRVTALKPLEKCDIMIGLLDYEVTPSIHPAKILPDDYAKYIGDGKGLPIVTFNQREQAYLSQLGGISTNATAGYVSNSAATNDAWKAFGGKIIGGDSGNPAFLLIGNEPILLYCLFSGGLGHGPSVFHHRREIQAVMDELCPGYKLEVFDFGKAAGDPIPLFSEPKVIARWTGVKPDVSKWKAVNTGVPSAKLNLTVNDDGTIDGQIVQNGLMLIVR